MMSYEGYQDRLLTCRDCGNDFTFSAGEQEFFASKGLTNAPSRCPDCRSARRNGQNNRAPRAPRGEQYDAICATCGQPTTVPFLPREDRPVYCSDCYQAQRAARPSREYSGTGRTGSSNPGANSGGRERRNNNRERYDRW